MLAVDSRFRKKKIGSTLVRKAIDAMIELEADEVTNLASGRRYSVFPLDSSEFCCFVILKILVA